jgi:acyl-CoA thioester hydrolase
MQWPVTYERKIRYSDTDAQKIVFNGNYLTYIDDTFTDYFDAMGTWDEVHGSGYDVVLGHIEVDFRSPARFGQSITCGVRAIEVGNTSIRFAFRVWETGTERTVVEGVAIQVMVDAHQLTKRSVPARMIEGIEALQGEPVPRRS